MGNWLGYRGLLIESIEICNYNNMKNIWSIKADFPREKWLEEIMAVSEK
jgi:hypothetical protein